MLELFFAISAQWGRIVAWLFWGGNTLTFGNRRLRVSLRSCRVPLFILSSFVLLFSNTSIPLLQRFFVIFLFWYLTFCTTSPSSVADVPRFCDVQK